MKTYTIIGGVNGVGKSSFTGVLKERSTDLGIIVDVNKITAELGAGALAGGKAALRKINECIDKGVSFTQETTLSGRWEAVAKVLPYCDEAEFYDNDNGFVKVAEYRNGELRTVGKHRPKWLAELQEYLNT